MNLKKFAERLKIARVQNNLSQNKLSEMTGISQAIISKYESSDNAVSPNALSVYLLAKGLKVSSEYLLGIEKDTAISPEYDNISSLKIVENYSSPTVKRTFEFIRMPVENPVDFFIQMEDNAMFPFFRKGDLLFFKASKSLEYNKTILFREKNTDKNCVRNCTLNNKIILSTPNSDYKSYKMEKEKFERTFHVLGIMTGHWGQLSDSYKDKNIF